MIQNYSYIVSETNSKFKEYCIIYSTVHFHCIIRMKSVDGNKRNSIIDYSEDSEFRSTGEKIDIKASRAGTNPSRRACEKF